MDVGAAKFDQLLATTKLKVAFIVKGLAPIYMRRFQFRVVRPSLPLADGADILQSPTKLQFQVPSVNIASSGGNHMLSPNAMPRKNRHNEKQKERCK